MQGVQNFSQHFRTSCIYIYMSTQARQKATFTATLIISHVSLTQAGEAVCNKSQTFHQTNRPNTSAKTQVKTKKMHRWHSR